VKITEALLRFFVEPVDEGQTAESDKKDDIRQRVSSYMASSAVQASAEADGSSEHEIRLVEPEPQPVQPEPATPSLASYLGLKEKEPEQPAAVEPVEVRETEPVVPEPVEVVAHEPEVVTHEPEVVAAEPEVVVPEAVEPEPAPAAESEEEDRPWWLMPREEPAPPEAVEQEPEEAPAAESEEEDRPWWLMPREEPAPPEAVEQEPEEAPIPSAEVESVAEAPVETPEVSDVAPKPWWIQDEPVETAEPAVEEDLAEAPVSEAADDEQARVAALEPSELAPVSTSVSTLLAKDLARLEATASLAEAAGLGFHLGSAVERIAAAGAEGTDGLPALKQAVWLIERYIALVERRPIGADVHASAARLARTGEAIARLKAIAAALDSALVADAEAEPEPDVEPQLED
jgi:hypothetical protein